MRSFCILLALLLLCLVFLYLLIWDLVRLSIIELPRGVWQSWVTRYKALAAAWK